MDTIERRDERIIHMTCEKLGLNDNTTNHVKKIYNVRWQWQQIINKKEKLDTLAAIIEFACRENNDKYVSLEQITLILYE